jgi:hypothetical protein
MAIVGFRKSLSSLTIPIGILLPMFLAGNGLSQPLSALQRPSEQLVSLEFPPVEDRGAPARTAGGGTRGAQCTDWQDLPLTSLVPTNNLGVTVSTDPTLFLYVPKSTAGSAELTVLDEGGNPVYQETFALLGTPGVIRVQVPAAVSLNVGKTYEWEFALICDPQDRERDRRVWGSLQRVELSQDLKRRVEQAVPLEQAKLYAEQRIWHEALSILAQLRSSNPKEWETFLKSVGLEEVAAKPLVECCTTQRQSAL